MCASVSDVETPEFSSRTRRGSIRAACLAALGVVFWLMGAETVGSQEALEGLLPSHYALGAGDRIRITVFGHEDLSGEFTIGESGAVSVPLAGALQLDGIALVDAERLVMEALKPDYLLNPRVSIEVLDYRPFYIIGEVNNPGAYPYVYGMTVTEAVALGGGFTYRARKNRVAVIRASDPARAEISIEVTDAVLPGDVVRVLERVF